MNSKDIGMSTRSLGFGFSILEDDPGRVGHKDGGACDSICFLKNALCEREIEILVAQQPPQRVFVCDHSGRVINRFLRVQYS